jgi:hypothetical protein
VRVVNARHEPALSSLYACAQREELLACLQEYKYDRELQEREAAKRGAIGASSGRVVRCVTAAPAAPLTQGPSCTFAARAASTLPPQA